MFIELVMLCNYSLPPPFHFAFSLSQHQGLFQWVCCLHQVDKVLELQHQSFQEYSGLISFKIDWFDLLTSTGLSAPQFRNISSSVLSFLYGPVLTSVHDYWKNHGFYYTDFVSQVMPLLFNLLSSIVMAFLPRSKRLLISWLQSLSAVILEPKKIKSVTVSTFPLLFAMKW